MDAQSRVMVDSDLLALGLGGTSMMAMLWTVASGRRAVGVEMRGDPFLGVHWNIREDLYHQLGLIDQLMFERFGEERIPRRANGKVFRLAESFYSRETSVDISSPMKSSTASTPTNTSSEPFKTSNSSTTGGAMGYPIVSSTS
jgi:hypothetical protein